VVFFYIVFGPPVRTREESVFDNKRKVHAGAPVSESE
jgi:hypothetical protein